MALPPRLITFAFTHDALPMSLYIIWSPTDGISGFFFGLTTAGAAGLWSNSGCTSSTWISTSAFPAFVSFSVSFLHYYQSHIHYYNWKLQFSDCYQLFLCWIQNHILWVYMEVPWHKYCHVYVTNTTLPSCPITIPGPFHLWSSSLL